MVPLDNMIIVLLLNSHLGEKLGVRDVTIFGSDVGSHVPSIGYSRVPHIVHPRIPKIGYPRVPNVLGSPRGPCIVGI